MGGSKIKQNSASAFVPAPLHLSRFTFHASPFTLHLSTPHRSRFAAFIQKLFTTPFYRIFHQIPLAARHLKVESRNPKLAPVRTADFDFDLPQELIAQRPAPRRDASRLLVLHRGSGRIEHRRFADLPDFLRAGDVLVLNDSRVFPARLHGANARTGGRFEILLPRGASGQ